MTAARKLEAAMGDIVEGAGAEGAGAEGAGAEGAGNASLECQKLCTGVAPAAQYAQTVIASSRSFSCGCSWRQCQAGSHATVCRDSGIDGMNCRLRRPVRCGFAAVLSNGRFSRLTQGSAWRAGSLGGYRLPIIPSLACSRCSWGAHHAVCPLPHGCCAEAARTKRLAPRCLLRACNKERRRRRSGRWRRRRREQWRRRGRRTSWRRSSLKVREIEPPQFFKAGARSRLAQWRRRRQERVRCRRP